MKNDDIFQLFFPKNQKTMMLIRSTATGELWLRQLGLGLGLGLGGLQLMSSTRMMRLHPEEQKKVK